MGLTRRLEQLAAEARVPVYAIAGNGARDAVQDLRLRSEIRIVDTPKAASILVVAGPIADVHAAALARVHDALPHPRTTVLWAPERALASLPGAVAVVVADSDPVAVVVAAYRDLVLGRRPSEPAILPDADPAEWRGVGPYGQGGSGMTGGAPYGRPMAELGPDPDGLRLDVVPVRVGPFFPRFPSGLVLDVRFSGDLVLDAAIGEGAVGPPVGPPRTGLRPFLRALTEPVPIAELELVRAREHLRWLADALVAHGLPALGARALRLAQRVQPGDGSTVRRLARLIGWTQVTRWSTRGVGTVSADDLAGLGAGPVARAAGLAEDVRLEDPAYRALGFEPVLGDRGDAAARWAVRLAEAADSLDLAARAGDARTTPIGRVESPRGRLEPGSAASARLLALVPQLLRETEWGDAVATVVSLDIDLDEAAHVEQLASAAVVA